MDVVKICEVVDGREDCPKYGDDCDGDKMTEHTDLISRADAIDAVRKCVVESELLADWNKAMESAQELLSELPSADAEFTDLPDIPRYYYEKVVGKMAHEINTLKGQLESAETHEIRTETHGVCSDLISREDAMGAVQDHFNADGFKGYDDGQQMMDRINALPSADAVQGEWKCMADCGVTECDQCGWSIEEYVGDYNYCPNCGAKMKGGDDE